MFCPQCKAEYRQGFTRCADCDLDLVCALEDTSQAPKEGGRECSANPDVRLIWKGHSESECVALCRKLMKADIPYKVSQSPEERYRMQVSWRYELGVSDGDYERAKEVLGIEGKFADSQDSEDELRLPEEAEDAKPLPPDDSPPDKEIRSDSYLEPWYPEDATEEVWSQCDEDISGGIEAALKENLVHCRVDLHNDVHKVLVLPEDAERSRQIVREIIESRPREPRA